MNYRLISPNSIQNYDVVEQVLTNRGIPKEEIYHYLHTTWDDVWDPAMIDRIHEGAQMLIQHIVNNDRIFIQVDSDADGYTSAAFLINYLNALFPGFTQNNITYKMHIGKQHGIVNNLISECLEKQYRLVILPDAGSNDYEQHQILKEHGIDVLVIDHHEADKISEYACIINNQLCDYPTKSLSGVGMVYKFCSYIDKMLEQSYANDFLDLVAIGLIADMMDLRDFETRFLISEGFKNLRNPFIKEINKVQNYSIEKGGGLNPFTVGFYIAPLINAITRVGTQEEKLTLFESMITYKAYEQVPSTKRGCKGQVETRVEQACRNCINVKNRQAKAVDNSLILIEKIIEDKQLLNNKILVLKLYPEWAVEKAITGLVANKLMSKYQRPVLILNQTIHDGEVYWEGSGRGYNDSDLDDFREFLVQTNLVEYAQGHPNAFGCGIKDNKIDEFIQYTNLILKDFSFEPHINVDFIWQSYDLNSNDILKLANLQWIWGQEINKPMVLIANIHVAADNAQLMKETTLKITLPFGISLIKFGSNEKEFKEVCPEQGYVIINVIGECKENVWGGNVTPQIEIKDLEIVDKVEYYF